MTISIMMLKTARLPIALSMILLVAGCSSLRPTTKLGLPQQAAFRHSLASAAPANVPAPHELAAWWEGFQDPTLTRLIETALLANLDIAQAQARLLESDALSRKARVDRLPTGTVAGDVARQRESLEGPLGQLASSAQGFERNQTLYEPRLEARWELDIFGRLRAAEKAARSGSIETNALLEGVRVRVAAETADAYLSMVGAAEQSAIVKRRVELQQTLAAAVKRRYEAGAARSSDIDQVNADLAIARAQAEDAAIALEVQGNRLRVLTGGGDITTATTRVPAPPPLGAIDSPSDVLRRRPDVVAAEARVAAADARIGAALAEYYPSVSIQGLVGFQALDADRLSSGSALNASGLLGIRWRLFDFPRIAAEVRAARARSAGAVAGYQAALLIATEEVENALFSLASRNRQARDFARASDALTSAAGASRKSFDAGVVALIDQLDVDRRLLAADQDEASARLAASRASVAVFRVIGGTISRADGLGSGPLAQRGDIAESAP